MRRPLPHPITAAGTRAIVRAGALLAALALAAAASAGEGDAPRYDIGPEQVEGIVFAPALDEAHVLGVLPPLRVDEDGPADVERRARWVGNRVTRTSMALERRCSLAQDMLRRVLAVPPGGGETAAGLADDAAPWAAWAIALCPDDADALGVRHAWLLATAGRTDDAAKAAVEVLADHDDSPHAPLAALLLGQLWMLEGDPAEALDPLRRAAQHGDPRIAAHATYQRAWAEVLLGRLDDALATTLDALRLAHQHDPGWAAALARAATRDLVPVVVELPADEALAMLETVCEGGDAGCASAARIQLARGLDERGRGEDAERVRTPPAAPDTPDAEGGDDPGAGDDPAAAAPPAEP